MNRWKSALLLFLILLVVVAPVFASEEGAEKPEATPLGWTMRIINFGVLFFGLLYLMRGAPAFFKKRAEEIVSAITEARAIKEEADMRLKSAEAKLARLDQEVADLRIVAKQDGAAEADRVRAMAREEEAKIQKAAQLEIEAAERAARMKLKAMAASLAVERAEAIVKSRMTPEAQAGLVRAFVGNLEKLN